MTRGSEARHLALLKGTFLFGALSEERLTEVAAATHERRYGGGELVFQKGDLPTGLFVVATGRIKEACQSPEGYEKIVELLGPGQTCGEAALLLGAPYPFFVATLVRSQLLHIDQHIVHALIDREPLFVDRLLRTLSDRLCGIVRDIEAYSLKSPMQRVADFLSERWTAEQPQIVLPVAKGMLASRLGMTPEALSRVFRDLSEAGVIEVRGSRVKVRNLARLREFALV